MLNRSADPQFYIHVCGLINEQVEGLMRLMKGMHVGPFNLGNPDEFTMLELAEVSI